MSDLLRSVVCWLFKVEVPGPADPVGTWSQNAETPPPGDRGGAFETNSGDQLVVESPPAAMLTADLVPVGASLRGCVNIEVLSFESAPAWGVLLGALTVLAETHQASPGRLRFLFEE